MRIALVTDAWFPQVNGVVRTMDHVRQELETKGHEIIPIHPGKFKTFPLPRYPEIRLPWFPFPGVRRMLDEARPDAIHITTEGTLGLAGRLYCRRRKLPFTTSYHTQYAQYVKKYTGIPLSITWRFLCWFHGGAEHTLVPTVSIERELGHHGFKNLLVWTRGVDTELFRPYDKHLHNGIPRPIFTYVGRVSVEKNLLPFLNADLPGSKIVVGDGPSLPSLQKSYPEVHFTGVKHGEELARHYAASDVFVFPSRTDTFGVVLLEAMACGVPVAAYPVTGPIDVVKHGVTGVLHEDIATAARKALKLDRSQCREWALQHTWQNCADLFLNALEKIEHKKQSESNMQTDQFAETSVHGSS